MPADKEWALLANYADRTLIRNIVAMRLSEICGFSWTPRMRSVEVYLNGKYQGVYTLCEHKKVSPDRVDIDLVDENDNSGDAVTGAATVILAMGAGRKAAKAIDEYIKSK